MKDFLKGCRLSATYVFPYNVSSYTLHGTVNNVQNFSFRGSSASVQQWIRNYAKWNCCIYQWNIFLRKF